MKRISTWQDAYGNGPITLDLGEGVTVDLRSLAPKDTGWRSLSMTNASTARTGTGTMQVRRVGERVTWRFNEVGLTDGTGPVVVIHSSEWANGFAPYAHGPIFHLSHEVGSAYVSTMKVVSSLYWLSLSAGTSLGNTRSSVALQGEFSYLTDDAWPTTLPGTAL